MAACRLLSQPSSPKSKKLKGPAGLPLASPVMDPGHLLTKLNADIAQKHRHEFSLETCLGPTIFHRTKVCRLHWSALYVCANLPTPHALLMLCLCAWTCHTDASHAKSCSESLTLHDETSMQSFLMGFRTKGACPCICAVCRHSLLPHSQSSHMYSFQVRWAVLSDMYQ